MGIAVDNYGNDLSGTTAQRPTSPYIGSMFFDTTLGQPIWWNGTAWVAATVALGAEAVSTNQPRQKQAAKDD